MTSQTYLALKAAKNFLRSKFRPSELDKLVNKSRPAAQKVISHYKSRVSSPFNTSPKDGHLRGIDFYNSIELVTVVAFLIGRHRLFYDEYLDLIQPRSYTEKINWSKLFREFKVPESGNKLMTEKFIPLDLIGSLSCPPLIWHSPIPVLPENDNIPAGKYYLKANHGSGMTKKITYPINSAEKKSLERLCKGWLNCNYGISAGEWFYNAFQKEILLQTSVTKAPEPISWNVNIFGGHIEMISAYQKTSTGGGEV